MCYFILLLITDKSYNLHKNLDSYITVTRQTDFYDEESLVFGFTIFINDFQGPY